MNESKESYIVEVSWGCPSDRYPLNGLFQFDQARAIHNEGERIIFLALDMRAVHRWRKWGLDRFTKDGIPVYEYNFPYGPFSPKIKYRIQDKCFGKAIDRICADHGKPGCIHFHGVMEAVSGMEWCMDHKVPYVITEHITPVHEGEEVHRRMRLAYQNADRVICVSNKLASDIESAYGAHTDAVIPNIVDLSLFSYAPAKTGDRYRFTAAAGLNAGKGVDVLLEAYAGLITDIRGKGSDSTTGSVREGSGKTSGTHLTIMGDGPERGRLEELASSLSISEYVSFTGEYVRSEFAEELHRTDCFVLPSRSETFGIVYVEAMAAGVPVIATRCGGPEDFVDETNGLLVPVDDVEALRSAMKKMMDISGDFDARKISECCRERFAPQTVAKEVIRVIGECRPEMNVHP